MKPSRSIRPPASPDPASIETAPTWACLKASRGACLIDVLVAPNAKKTECMGLHDNALRIRLAAPPVDGAANDQLLKWFAAELGLPKQAVQLIKGQTSKRKQVQLDTSVEDVTRWLELRGRA